MACRSAHLASSHFPPKLPVDQSLLQTRLPHAADSSCKSRASWVTLLFCRTSYQAESKQVQAAAAALKDAFDTELADIRSELEAELAAVKSSAAKSAAKAKAERQNAHTLDRERNQAELKEVLAER